MRDGILEHNQSLITEIKSDVKACFRGEVVFFDFHTILYFLTERKKIYYKIRI